jgi:phytoene synthase
VLLDTGRLAPDLLLPIIDAYEIELQPCIETLSEWRSWLLAGAGGIATAAGRLLAYSDPERLRGTGAAFGAARVIRWHPVLAKRGRCLLPADLLAREGVSAHGAIASPGSPAVMSVLGHLAVAGRGFLESGPSGRVTRAFVAAALPAVLARRDLRRWPRLQPGYRGLADRLAVTWAGLSGRV